MREWKQAQDQKIQSLVENEVWELQDLPPGKRFTEYRVKTNQDGSVERFKTRLVVRNFSQRKGTAFDQTLSPIVSVYNLFNLSEITCLDLKYYFPKLFS